MILKKSRTEGGGSNFTILYIYIFYDLLNVSCEGCWDGISSSASFFGNT